MAVMLSVSDPEFPPRAATAPASSSLRPPAAAPVAAAVRYTFSCSSPLSRERTWEAVESGALEIVVVVVDAATLPWETASLLFPQPVARRPTVRTAAPNRSGRRCTPIIVFPFRVRFAGPDTTVIQPGDLVRTNE